MTFHQTNQLGEIVVDSPPLNLFSGELLSDLRVAIDQAAESEIRALLIRAEGDDFSAGADVSLFMGLDEAGAGELQETVLGLILAVEGIAVPSLALIQGQCYAGALELCLACDLIWIAEGSVIGQVEALAGGIPYAGGTQRIASRIGAARAAEMVLTAAIPPPETLLSWGLVNRVVPADDLAREGRAFAEKLANGPTLAHATVKRLLHAWRTGGVGAADEVDRAEGPAVMLSEDLQNGVVSLQRDGIGHATFHGR